MDVHHHEETVPMAALSTMADSLPGLGIVAALLGAAQQQQAGAGSSGGYFKDPTGTSKQVGSNMQGSGEAFALTRDDMPKLKEELQKSVRQLADLDKLQDHIEMTVTEEGLPIELIKGRRERFSRAAVRRRRPMGKNS